MTNRRGCFNRGWTRDAFPHADITDTSCRGCTKRYPGCHSQCEVYRDYRKRLNKSKENIAHIKHYLREENEKDVYTDSVG